jgi:hypothetical protein
VVAAYAVSGRVVLTAFVPLDRSGAGWTATDALAVLEEDVGDDVLGAAVEDMLERSLTAPRPSAPSEGARALLDAAKVRSHRALVRTARYVSVDRDGEGRVLLLPAAPGRRGGGWITVGHEEGIVVADPSPSDLGRALRTAIERSTTTPVDD